MVMEILISLTLLFLGIVALAVIHVCIVVRAFSRGNEHIGLALGNNSETKMSNEDLKKLPCFEYKAAADRGSGPVDCVEEISVPGAVGINIGSSASTPEIENLQFKLEIASLRLAAWTYPMSRIRQICAVPA
ncbi:hypothetical protein Pint_15418 [Pistacia integerrima]|uniref:Uncharacterized protein n=1 Tax=Pistacia integerrima TaxID=434235 RepID=A0ACC0ZBJ4_9ROSI|nr:hypothetical protein Pint_15418 [Pistacia integerrima]